MAAEDNGRDGSQDGNPGLGERLRALRGAHGYSLARVSDATGISTSFLSLVEKGRSDITLGRLTRLVRFYGISLTELMPEVATSDPMIIRKGQAQHFSSPAEGIDIFLLTSDTNRVMTPYLGVFRPGAHPAEYAQHEGDEFLYVLEGAIRIEIDGAAPAVLNPGDAAYFRANRAHSFANVGKTPARIVGAATPPTI